MGSINITSIKRRQFASEVVGTPGVDDSTARGLNSLANSTFQIGRKFQQNEILTNKVQAAKEAQITEEEVRKSTAEIQAIYNADSSRDPAEGVRRAKESERIIRNRRLTEIDNRKVRGMSALINEQNSVRTGAANNKWALKLQGINMLSNGTEAINGLATTAELPTDFDTFIDLLQQGEQIGKSVAVGLDAKQGAKFVKDSPESITRARLNGLMKRDPEEGLEEFKTKGIYNTIFDSDERKKIEKGFVSAINGKNELTNYQSHLDLAKLNKDAANDPTLLNNIDWVQGQKQKLSELSLLPQGVVVDGVKLTQQQIRSAEADYDRQVVSILENNKLNEVIDPQTIMDLSAEFAQFGISKSGVVKENIENFNDVFDFSMRLNQARADGKISDTSYKGLAIPLQIAVENISSAKEAESEFSIGRAAESFAKSVVGDFSGGWGFQKNPTNFGITEVDKYLTPLELGETKLKNVRGSMLSDLFLAIQQDRSRGVSLTNESISNNMIKVIRENGARFGLPIFNEGEGPLHHNSATNQIEQQQLDGSWKVVK